MKAASTLGPVPAAAAGTPVLDRRNTYDGATERLGPRSAVLVTVERHAIVGRRMDYQAATIDAIADNGAALQYAQQAAQGGSFIALEACRTLRMQRVRFEGLLAGLRKECGELDGLASLDAAEVAG